MSRAVPKRRRNARSALGQLALAGALLLPWPATSNEHDIDLDALPTEQLDAALDAELGADDLWQFGIDVQKAYPLKVLHAAILRALSDEGDDEDEQIITEADLQEEMEEAGADLGEVVWHALQQADQIASRRPASHYLRVVAGILAREDGLTVGGVGATQSKQAVRATIVRARR